MENKQPATIMIIEDDRYQIDLLEEILSGEGYRLAGFENSERALGQIALLKPDLILLDLLMPNLDGFEVCRRLKADSQTTGIPIIIVTATYDQATESKCLGMGAVDYVTKPIDATVVKARVRTHLELKRHRDQLESLVQKRTDERDTSQRQFRDLVEKSLVGIAIAQNGRVVYQNPELKRMESDLAARIEAGDFSFIHPHDLPKLQQAYDKLSTEATYVEVDFRILPVRGAMSDNMIYINARANRFAYQGGEAILINLVNITHTKELERLLLIRNKMSSLGRIASGMAHEIRNPLTGITSYLYTLEQLCGSQTLLPKDLDLMKQIIGQLKLACHKVDAVIKRVLDFSRPSVPQMTHADINTCIESVMKLTAVTLRKAGVHFTCNLGKDLPHCYVDVALIEQVLLNLIQNSSRALKKAGDEKMINVSSRYEKNNLIVAVDDSGPGVPHDLREKIFDPFFTTSPEGSGIGLSIAHRIVSDHNGTLTVHRSELGGARFVVALPIEKRKA